ncbi:CCA tRNA nucleotidyltransferase [Candidatus Hydrogenosomobacter endosymbioticus]|nr:CCA tRNA nucleotidyltransferase [Candidatus Hydrogenosomobacter endosymbioticus]
MLISELSGEGRFVGGAVRNSLLGLPFDDFDIATTLLPNELMAGLSDKGVCVIPTGIEQGTVTAVIEKQPYEITTLRRDEETDGRRAKVKFTNSWEADASRRDFTINAIYVDSNGKLYDYFNGLQDISLGKVRFIGNPTQRIKEDFLRILRFFRMHAFYAKTELNEECLSACIELRHNLRIISGERITKEILRMLCSKNPWPCIRSMHKNDFFKHIFTINEQAPSFNSQIFENICQLEKTLRMQSDNLTRLCSIGGHHFPRLRLSRNQQKFLNLVYSCSASISHAKTSIAKNIYTCGKDITIGSLWIQQAANMHEKHEAGSSAERLKKAIEFVNTYEITEFPITGKDMLSLGLTGEKIKHSLAYARNWWIDRWAESGTYPSAQDCINHLMDKINNIKL